VSTRTAAMTGRACQRDAQRPPGAPYSLKGPAFRSRRVYWASRTDPVKDRSNSERSVASPNSATGRPAPRGAAFPQRPLFRRAPAWNQGYHGVTRNRKQAVPSLENSGACRLMPRIDPVAQRS
jgi:hypothetical protein